MARRVLSASAFGYHRYNTEAKFNHCYIFYYAFKTKCIWIATERWFSLWCRIFAKQWPIPLLLRWILDISLLKIKGWTIRKVMGGGGGGIFSLLCGVKLQNSKCSIFKRQRMISSWKPSTKFILRTSNSQWRIKTQGFFYNSGFLNFDDVTWKPRIPVRPVGGSGANLPWEKCENLDML